MIKKAIELAQLLSLIANNSDYYTIYNKITEIIYNTLRKDKTIFICGNGGSHAIALHFAGEFTGRYKDTKPAYPVMALGEATHTTCVANDYNFDMVFSRQLDAFGKKGDVLIVMSTSGNSKNILEILNLAKQHEITSIALLGKDGGKAKGMADLEFIVPHKDTARIQEIHQFLLHSIAEDVLNNL